MNNGTSQRVIEHFNKVSTLPDTWDHNQQYQKYMLKQFKHCKEGLDIGCGTGEMTNKLSERCDKVIGIDVAPMMIAQANKRNRRKNIRYINSDVSTYLDSIENKLDVIVSIAAFHHMDYENMLKKCKKALKKDGVLIIQDLYNENTLIFKLLSFIGMLTNPFFMLIKNKRITVPRHHQDIWKSHRQDDHYNSIREIKSMADNCLGKCKIKRHIFWRYTLVYIKSN